MALLHLALANPQMAEYLARLGRDPAIQWSLLMVGLIVLIRLAWIVLRHGRLPGLVDVLRAVGLGTALVLGVAFLALVVALPFAVGPRMGLAGFEIHFVSVVLVAGFIAAVCLIYWFGGRRRDETEDRETN